MRLLIVCFTFKIYICLFHLTLKSAADENFLDRFKGIGLWPFGIIPYIYLGDIPAKFRFNFNRAISVIEDVSCVRYVVI